jgi:hypothetical protein
MWKPPTPKRSTPTANKLHAAQTPVRLVPRTKEPLMAGRRRSPTRFLVLTVGALSLAALVLFVSAAASQTRAPRATKALHATKDCSGFKGVAGNFCTIRSSNVKALKVGSKIFYLQQCCKAELNSDTAIYAGPGNIAAGHCFLDYKTGTGLCTISDGTGTLAGLHARIRVTTDSSIPDLYHWDGTYSFSNG